MGEAAFDQERPFVTSGLRAAVVLCRTEHGNLHAGLLHRGPEGEVLALHLGWQDYLSTDWSWRRLWATPEVEPEKLTAAAGHCRRIWKVYESNRTFPYALAFCGSTFDGQGQLLLGEGSRGLTCATLILAVFETSGVTLVDEADWPTRPDDDRRYLDSIAGFASDEHLALLREEVANGCKRIRPDEVLGACAVNELPAKFAPTSEAARRVVEKLDDRESD